MDISGLEVGTVVLAKGYGPAGGRTWFLARITKFRPRFPPIVVAFTATHPMGLTQQLLLPQPKVAHVSRSDVRLLDDETPDAPAATPNRLPPPVRSDPVMVHELEGRRVSCERNGRRLDGEVLAASAKGTRFTIEWHDGSQATHPRAHAPTRPRLSHSVWRCALQRAQQPVPLCARGQPPAEAPPDHVLVPACAEQAQQARAAADAVPAAEGGGPLLPSRLQEER